MTGPLRCEELSPERWADVEALFGSKGACGGCWCQSWKVAKGEKWAEIQGEGAKARFQAQIEAGEAMGVLAYLGDRPVGWAALGPRPSFAKLDRAPSFACDDADAVWSLPCFFVVSGHRGQGVATALLKAAEAAVAKRGGTLVEAYPAKPLASGKPLPGAFAWTGPRAMFDAAGFEVVGKPDGGKARMRKALQP